MKKLIIFILSLTIFFSITSILTFAKSDVYKVGMEAGYPPFNWTQKTKKNGAVLIEGSDQYANGYDVQIAKKVAKEMNKKLVVVKIKWDGLIPALTSGKIDAIVAGMSPTKERRDTIDFSNSYYTSQIVIVVNKNGKFANAKSIQDFKNAKITAQQGTFHYNLISQMNGVKKQPAMGDFSGMRVATQSNTIDGYIGERPEGLTAQVNDPKLKMITFSKTNGFKTKADEVMTSIGVLKGNQDLSIINDVLSKISDKKRVQLMDKMTSLQNHPEKADGFWQQVAMIIKANGTYFVAGAGVTLFISIIGTIIGTIIGLLIGVFKTAPKSSNKYLSIINAIFNAILNIYVEIFRGTPMIVQAMIIYYGSAQFLGISIDKLWAALFIVSINTGAYMTEIVRGGIFAVDKGQFEAAAALGMNHNQAMMKVILPQTIRNILPAAGNEFVINIKDTSVLNVISVSELFFAGNTIAQQNYQYFQTFTIISVIYFVLTFTVTRILRFVEKKLDTVKVTTGANQMQVKLEVEK
ncbi:MAG: ABC transporter substrate-binding protein/permease [Lactobacillaceae bacterium]|jgi:putative lysine transport system permease protein|nr:ABC transporter substrate-binding protein/permease [Lactobacillaceae bacterium]